MKNILFVISVMALCASARATEPMAGPSMQALQAMAEGTCPADKCFDGTPILRREGPLAILEEKKIGHTNARHMHGGRGDGGTYYPPTDIYKQKVAIVDRKGYVSEEKSGGQFKGGMIGLLGLLGFLAGPIVGLGILAATVTTGIVVGGKKAEASAAKQPDVFERTQSYEVNR